MKPGLLLYRFSLWIFAVGAKVAALFNPKAKLFVQGRKAIFKTIAQGISQNPSAKRIWFHCASLGEFEQGRPVIEKIKADFPGYDIFLTFYSPSGYEVRKNYPLAEFVSYLPLDSSENAKRFLDIVKPDLAFFVKYEFWHYYLAEMKKRHIPVLSISAIFRPDQLFFKPYGSFYRQMLRCFDHIFVQNQVSKELLAKIGITQVSLSGDTRFDRVASLVSQRTETPLAAKFQNGQPTLVIGSSWPEDMDVLMPFINKNSYNLKFIIAPHEISEENIQAIESATSLACIRYSQAQLSEADQYKVLIIDNIGLLSSLYAYGDYAYIGGAFGKGLHNILEAATYGVPIIFGSKSYGKFQEAKDLIALGGAFAIQNQDELSKVFQKLSQFSARTAAGQINQTYVESNTGATDKIMAYCQPILNSR